MATLQPDYSQTFINPYNFIAKTTHVAREHVQKGALSGSISCRLVVKNDLALPDHNSSADRRYEFFQIDGKPIVPGGEIKGCIRSVYEALTPSCFSVINANVLTKRLSKPASSKDRIVLPGILRYEDDGWVIYEAEKYKPDAYWGGPPTLKRKWPESGVGKRKNEVRIKESYFVANGKAPDYYCSRDTVDSYIELLEIFKSYAKESTQGADVTRIIAEMINRIDNNEDVPVFYRIDQNGELNYLSPAQVSRYMFHNTVASLLGDHAAGLCGKDEQYCPACSLFGTLGAGNALASRLRFGDAEAENVVISNKFVNLPELSSPKITSVEFYSNKGAPYENAVDWDYDSPGVALNGRKYYYHSEPKDDKVLGARSFATKPALPGSVFRFNVWFDNISREQLRQLLWVLTIGDNTEDSRFCHKLGAGKPIGYGSVKILVNDIKIRSFASGSYQVEKKTIDDFAVSEALFTEKAAMRDFLRIADRAYVSGRNVSYPIADNGNGNANAPAAHQWFSSNRLPGNKTRPSQFRFVLHPLCENVDDLELPAMVNNAPDPVTNTPKKQNGDRQFTARPQDNRASAENGLQVGKTYNAIIVSVFINRSGDEFFNLSVNGMTKINGKIISIPKRYANGKTIGDTVSVRYDGMKDQGFPKLWVNRDR